MKMSLKKDGEYKDLYDNGQLCIHSHAFIKAKNKQRTQESILILTRTYYKTNNINIMRIFIIEIKFINIILSTMSAIICSKNISLWGKYKHIIMSKGRESKFVKETKIRLDSLKLTLKNIHQKIHQKIIDIRKFLEYMDRYQYIWNLPDHNKFSPVRKLVNDKLNEFCDQGIDFVKYYKKFKFEIRCKYLIKNGETFCKNTSITSDICPYHKNIQNMYLDDINRNINIIDLSKIILDYVNPALLEYKY